MKNSHILTLAAATMLAGATVYAQAPAAPATTTPAGTATGTSGAVSTGTTTGTTGAAATTAKPKPLSTNEGKAVLDLLNAMQFHIRMGEIARHKDKDDKELVTFANKNHKEMTELYTPLVGVAQTANLKNIPMEASKADKADMAKIGKPKAEKWKEDYFELLFKNGKRNARTAENAVKTIADPTAKDLATKAAAAMASQTAEAETKYKELKDKK
jgi:hypothetical protein